MAKVVQTQQQVIIEPWWLKIKIIGIGLGAGVLWWVLTVLFRQYIVEPLACRDLSTAAACVDSFSVSGSIATVLVAVIGLIFLVRFIQPRPIIIALSSAVALWNLGALVEGLAWWWSLLFSVVLYVISYTLFGLVARIPWLLWSIVLAVLIVAGTRILLAF